MGLTFSDGVGRGDALLLYCAAGPNGEQDAIFGRLSVTDSLVPPPRK